MEATGLRSSDDRALRQGKVVIDRASATLLLLLDRATRGFLFAASSALATKSLVIFATFARISAPVEGLLDCSEHLALERGFVYY